MRLRARLILMIIIAAGPALALFVYSQFVARAGQQSEMHRRALETARSAAAYSAATIRGMQRVAVGIGTMLPQLESDRRLCTEIARRLNENRDNYVSFAAFATDGRSLCDDQDLDEPAHRGLTGLSQSQPLLVAHVAQPDADAASAITLIETVIKENEIRGFVAVVLSVEWLEEEARHYPLEGITALSLVDRSGEILLHRSDTEYWQGRFLQDSVLRTIRSSAEGTMEIIGTDSRRHIAALAPVPAFADDLFVLIGIDSDHHLEALHNEMLRNAAVLGLIVLAIAATAIASWGTAGALQRRETQLAEAKAAAERLAAGQQRVADTIGHDLRNSVQTLVSFLRNLRRNGDRPPDPAMMPYVARAVSDLRSSLDMLIRASRLETGTLEPHRRTVQLSVFLQKVSEDWRFYAETKGLTLTVIAGSETVETDPDLLRTVVSNLVGNAIKHTDAGGVTVSVEPDAAGRTCIGVSDTGAGIPPGKAAVIFEAFSRLDPEKTEGLGLGLSIAKRTADLLGCEIVLDRTVNTGSRFVVKCPDMAARPPIGACPRHDAGASPASAGAAFP